MLSCNKEEPCPPITIEVTVINQTTKIADFSACAAGYYTGCDQEDRFCTTFRDVEGGQTAEKEINKLGIFELQFWVFVEGQLSGLVEDVEESKFSETLETGKITLYLKYNNTYYLEIL